MIRSLPLTALSLLIGFFFIFIGSIKLTPKVNEEIFRDMKQEFGRYNKVFPFYKYTGWRPYAKNYRLAVGIMETVCGAILILIPGPLKEVACVLLFLLLVGAGYTHYALKDPFERLSPSLSFGLLIVCRMIILYQVNRKERLEEAMINRLLAEARARKEKIEASGDEVSSQEEKLLDEEAKSRNESKKIM